MKKPVDIRFTIDENERNGEKFPVTGNTSPVERHLIHLFLFVIKFVSNYGSTTTDHYPVFTRFPFDHVILPVLLVGFNAVKQGSKTKLNCTTSQELNSLEFIVERSTNGSAWQIVAVIPAQGNSNIPVDYVAYDVNPAKGINLYRLKSVDIDKKFDYSSIRPVNFNSKHTYSLYPNPVNDVLRVTVDDVAGLNAEVQVLNMQSQLLINKKLNTIQPLQLNVSSFTAGIYFLKIVSPDGTVTAQKFVKQ